MNVLTLLASQLETPSGLWSSLINWLHGGIGNFGWTILILSFIVKIIVSPLEFFVKLNTKKQTLMQQKCAPQVAKLQKKFGKDQKTLRIQQNALYKREGVNMGTGCIIMMINMIITFAVFISFYSALRDNSAYRAIQQYENLSAIAENNNIELLQGKEVVIGYETEELNNEEQIEEQTESSESVTIQIKKVISTEEEAKEFIDLFNKSSKIFALDAESKEVDLTGDEHDLQYYLGIYTDNKPLIEEINLETTKVVVDAWNETKTSWLWIDNIWVSDAMIYPFPAYDNFITIASSGKYTKYINELIKEDSADAGETENNVSYDVTFQEKYNSLVSMISHGGGRRYNGYFILAIVVAILSFASQYLAELHTNKIKNKKAETLAKQSDVSMQQSMKLMKFILPIVMVVFILRSSASFGIYILASNIVSIVVGEVSTLIIDKITHKKQLEVEEYLEKEADRLIKKGKLQENK